MDSYISLGDKTNIQDEVTTIEDVWGVDVTTQEFACNGDNAYFLEWYSDGEKFIRIFKPVPGAKTYLKVEIEDRTGMQDSQTLIKTYAANF